MSSVSISDRFALAPLREWKERESERQISAPQTPGRCDAANKQMFLRKTAVAYGIAELLRQTRSHRYSASSQVSLDGQCNINNFVVRTKVFGRSSHPTWRDIDGVEMLSPRLLAIIVEPSFLWDGDDGDREEMGSFLEVEFPSLPVSDGAAVFVNQSEEDTRCHLFGVLLYELFFECSPLSAGNTRGIRAHTDEGGLKSALENDDVPPESASKKTKLVDLRAAGAPGIRSSTAHVSREISYSALQREGIAALLEEGIPSSLCLVIQNLLDCGEDDRPDNAYGSLEEVIIDLHLLLLDPIRFLFDHEPAYDNNGRIKLLFREHRLYGRENEELLITEAFCRVSSGKSESLFIGGFSGSGKTRLVNGLTPSVDVSGGYVLTHKFDQLSQEKTMLEVVAIFNDLCLLIRDKNSQQDLLDMVNNLVCVFGSDLPVLARLLPNIKSLTPQLDSSDDVQESHNQMNLRSICFTLQRFIRVVSSEVHPVVLFLDDLQWCDKSALTVVESLLCDATGSACLFFLGTYRSNEVAGDHKILCLAQRLKSFGVPTTMLSLEGLNPKDLNVMISDALCVFPRISEPLSDIIYQKTKGNPFFVLAFMRSLVDTGLLEYSINTKRWVWDEDELSSLDVTGNVLYLLSSKMSGLSTSIQSALKIAACFGIKIKQSVVATLGADPEHSDIREKLEQVVKEGFMVKIGTSDFKFVHDKVRETAYSLIPEKDKDQFHYSLGMSLYLMTKGKGMDNVVFSIADQIKHGIGSLADENPELQIDIAKLYELSGTKALACSDYGTSRSYLTYALSLLPTDHWKSHYNLSLQISLRLAKSCYSCGNVEKAQCMLQEMTEQCHSIEDKIPGNVLLADILMSGKKFTEAYTLCREVLSQLGEDIPEELQAYQISEMVESTSKIVERISDKDLLEMKEMDERLSIFIHFYCIMGCASFVGKPEMLPFIACRIVQLTMKNGLSIYSIHGFVQYAVVLLSSNNVKNRVESASRIGKAAMSCYRERYNTAYMLPALYSIYYGHVAFHTEPLHTCADMLRQGFDAGISLGESGMAFYNAIQHIKTAVVAGDRLPSLLEKVDYYLEQANTYQNENAKAYLSIFRGTISTLIDKGDSTSASPLAIDVPTNTANAHLLESINFHRVVQAYWQGYSERCQHYIGKLPQKSSISGGKLNSVVIVFIHGMNSFRLMKKKPTNKLTSITKKSIRVLKTAAIHSCWNFLNKVHLLEAEEFSSNGNHRNAQASYAAAINSARSSGFIHEQGLACELAGYHYKMISDFSSAWSFFDQAKRCYTEWGSQMKVDSVTEQLESLTDYTPIGPSL